MGAYHTTLYGEIPTYSYPLPLNKYAFVINIFGLILTCSAMYGIGL
jgi:hypothetical protein